MIPVYNCIGYLEETLNSVLSRALGPEYMQIAVIDDRSTDGDVQGLVERVGKNRIEYFQQPTNVGSLRNFETCLNHSTGHWVHLLHGDDRVLPGFYAEIEALFAAYPEAGAAFTNWHQDNDADTTETQGLEPGIIKDFLIQNAQRLLVQPPAIVVKRAVYEKVGGFFAVYYGEDWEMWTRIAVHFPIAYSPKKLAYYRYMGKNSITQRAIATGQNAADIIKVIDIIQQYLPPDQRQQVKRIARFYYAIYCADLSYSLAPTNLRSAILQAKGALKLSHNSKVFTLLLKYLTRHITKVLTGRRLS